MYRIRLHGRDGQGIKTAAFSAAHCTEWGLRCRMRLAEALPVKVGMLAVDDWGTE